MSTKNKLEIIFLGTGHAAVTEYYNTCFVIKEGKRAFLVDSGGGNGLLKQLKESKIEIEEIESIFISHKHIDHILGVLWLLRYYAHHEGGRVRLYSHHDVIVTLKDIARSLLTPKQWESLKKSVEFISVENDQYVTILGRGVIFFDINSDKEKQFGFCMFLKEGRLVFLGDEPCSEAGLKYARESKWLLHEAFCLKSEADVFEPYEKHHSTVLDACKLAEELGVENLFLYHTEDTHLDSKKKLYTEEGREYFSRNLYVPNDLERFTLEE